MTKLYLFLLAIIFGGCTGPSEKTNPDPLDDDPIRVIQEREQNALEKRQEAPGTLISTIDFRVKTLNTVDFEGGIIPWANLQNPETDLPKLFDKDEVVLKDRLIRIIIAYPLTNPYEFTLTSNNGFTRSQLLLEISSIYYKIFEEEEETATIKTIPPDKRTRMMNRNETNGKYGIWGHDIADLDLSSISVYRTTNGDIVLSLDIES